MVLFATISPPYFCPILPPVSDPSSSSAASGAFVASVFAPARFRLPCSYHLLDTLSPGCRSASIHKYMIEWVLMYCATIYCNRQHISQRPPVLPLTLPNPEGGTARYCQRPSAVFFSSYGGPPYGEIPLESFQCAGSLPKSMISTGLPPQTPTCRISPISWIMSPPAPKYMEVFGEGDGFFIAPVSISTSIGFKEVLQVIQFWSCVGKCWLKGLVNNFFK